MVMTMPSGIRRAGRLTGFVMANEADHRVGSPFSAGYRYTHTVLLLALALSGIGCDGDGMLFPDPSVQVLAFGDSSTSGISGRSYPEILAELIELPPRALANQGKDGETTGEGLDRLRRLLSFRIYPNAGILLYWEGGGDAVRLIREVDGLLLLSPVATSYPYTTRLNETLDRAQANIEAAIAEGQKAGMTVYVATYFSLRESIAPCEPLALDIMLPFQARNANDYISLLNDRIRRAALNAGATVLDIASADDDLHADPANFFNCNHLSAAGNAIVAQLFAESLVQ